MKNFFRKFHSKKSSSSPSGSTGHRSSSDSNSQSTTHDHTPPHLIRASSPVAIASLGPPIPSRSEGLQPSSPEASLSATSSQKPPASTNIDQLNTSEVNTSSSVENKPGWKTTMLNGARMALELVKESADAFGPLKSVAGGLSALLSQYDVSYPSLIP